MLCNAANDEQQEHNKQSIKRGSQQQNVICIRNTFIVPYANIAPQNTNDTEGKLSNSIVNSVINSPPTE